MIGRKSRPRLLSQGELPSETFRVLLIGAWRRLALTTDIVAESPWKWDNIDPGYMHKYGVRSTEKKSEKHGQIRISGEYEHYTTISNLDSP